VGYLLLLIGKSSLERDFLGHERPGKRELTVEMSAELSLTAELTPIPLDNKQYSCNN
jgi:hypothetical protein